MSGALSLAPVSAAIYAALNVPAMQALAPGGVWAVTPQGAQFPSLLFVVSENQQLGGLGTKVGVGMLPEVGIRLHAFSAYAGFQESHAIIEKARELLADPPAVAGYNSWFIAWDDVIPIPDELMGGLRVSEVVANGRLYVEAQS
jgi:hypothetical protein